MRLDAVATPCLVVDLDRLEANLARMAERARRLGVRLRPHVKTHKCIEVGRRQLAAGARGITVATLDEAEAFAAHGFDDLVWAFPVIPGRIGQAAALAGRVRLAVVVDSAVAIDALEAAEARLDVLLKVDSGFRRAGVDPEGALAVELARRLDDASRLNFAGLLSHSGHAYAGPGAALEAARQERDRITALAHRLRAGGVRVASVSVGSTPGMAAIDHLDGVDEARPGNYALYDYTQVALGACTPADCAATVVATVVSCQPGAGHAVVDAGALALSKDPGPKGEAGFGRLFADYPAGRLDERRRLVSLSQEHGVLDAPAPVGSRVRILPNHSCLTVAQFDEMVVARGDEVVDRWKVWRARS